MQLKDKIEKQEQEVRVQLSTLRETLNQLSTKQKSNPNDWSYLSAIGIAATTLKELNNQIQSITTLSK